MRGQGSHDDPIARLGDELRAGRPEPRPELLGELVARTRADRRPAAAAQRASARRPRFALAAAFLVLVLALLAAFGGVGYATSSVKGAAKSVSHAVSGKKDGESRSTQSSRRRNDDEGDNGNNGNNGNGGNNGNNGNGGNGGSQGGNGGGQGGDDDEEDDPRGDHDPPWVQQYSRYVLVCYPFTVGQRTVFRTIVVPRQFVGVFVPPGTRGACGFRDRDDT